MNILPKFRYFEGRNYIQIGYKSYSVGTSWIFGKEGTLEKGGVDLEKRV